MSQLTSADYRGACLLKPTGGSQFVIPAGLINPSNPMNNSYPMLINSNTQPANFVLGKKTPALVIQTVVKSSWFTAANLNQLIVTTDSYGNTQEYAIGIWDGEAWRVFDGCRCAGITLQSGAAGGGIAAELAFLCRYGDNEAPTPTSFSAASVDPGALRNVSQVDFGSTATATSVAGFSVNIVRRQEYLAVYDGTQYMAEVASGPLGGVVQLTQYTKAGTVPSTSSTLRIGTTTGGVQFAFLQQLDEFKRVHTPGLGIMSRTYSVVDPSAGTSAVAITAVP